MTDCRVPMRSIGPVLLSGPVVSGEVLVPLATFETPLWPSTSRGAKVSRLAGGIYVDILSDCMTRSVVVEASTLAAIRRVQVWLEAQMDQMQAVVSETSRFAKLTHIHTECVGRLLYIRFQFSTGDASGHNMATKAAEALLDWLLKAQTACRYVSISANLCTDKKVSAVNGLLGRGKSAVAEIVIPRAVCESVLKTTPEAIVDLHIKKNLIGTNLAGTIRTANAHFANILLAFYLAVGQDAANIIEGSQGMVHTECQGEDLYFSVTLPNLIVGTVGNGKGHDFVCENLSQLGCDVDAPAGENAKKLAAIIAATVLCGELSLLAAQTNPGELMRSHIAFERRHVGV